MATKQFKEYNYNLIYVMLVFLFIGGLIVPNIHFVDRTPTQKELSPNSLIIAMFSAFGAAAVSLVYFCVSVKTFKIEGGKMYQLDTKTTTQQTINKWIEVKQ